MDFNFTDRETKFLIKAKEAGKTPKEAIDFIMTKRSQSGNRDQVLASFPSTGAPQLATEPSMIEKGVQGVKEGFGQLAGRIGSGIKEEFNEGAEVAQEARQKLQEGEPLEAAAKTFVAGEKAIMSPITGLISGIAEPAIQDATQAIKSKWEEKASDSDKAKLREIVSNMAQGYENLPSEAKTALQVLGSLVDIGTTFEGGKIVGKAGTEAIETVVPKVSGAVEDIGMATKKQIGEVAESLEKSAEKGFIKEAEQIAVPELGELTKNQRQNVARRITEERFGGRSIVPDNREELAIQQIKEMEKLGKISAKDSTVKQIKSIDNEISDLALNLEKKLKDSPSGQMTKDSFDSLMDDVQGALSENITITGDAEKSVQKLINQAKKEVADIDNIEAIDILRARKSLDDFIKLQKGSGVFDPKTENALSTAIREIRQTLNAQAAELSPSVDVKNALRQQSSLFDALNVVENRFARESASTLGRILQKVQSATGLPKSEIIETIGLTGLITGGAIASPALVPLFVGAGLLRAGSKVLTNPRLKNGLAKLLKKISDKELKSELKGFISEL